MKKRLHIFRILLSVVCVALPLWAAAADKVLTGTPIGSGSYNPQSGTYSTTVNTPACAFDGSADTYFSAYDPSMGWVGLDLGTPHVISRVGLQPYGGLSGARKMQLGIFEGANNPDFMDAVPLYLVDDTPASTGMTRFGVKVTRGFRYVRYVGPDKSRSQVAELEFYGHEGEGTDSLFYQVTDLPTVSIHVQDNYVPQSKGQDFVSNVTIVYDGGRRIQEYPILTRVRGNYSASHENKPYRIKFADEKKHHMFKGSERDESPAKAKKWTLVNSFGDKTLVRNNIAFEVSQRIGMPFTPWCRSVDLLLNGEYRGCYQLTDHVSSNPERIPITEMTETDIDGEALTGGYLIEMNGYASGDPINFTSSRGNPISVHEPEDDVIQQVQYRYIRDYFNAMEERVFSSNYTDPENGYRPMLDLDSFLKYFLANEFSGNTDMLWQVYMYKERGDSLIYTGPVWDNDLSLENDGSVYPGNEREEWTYPVRGAGNWRQFVSRILSDQSAMGQLQEMWARLREDSIFTHQNIEQYIDSLRELTRASARLNFIRWPYLLQKVHCNPVVWGSWEAEMDNVKNYASGRIDWMDKKLAFGPLQLVNGVYQINTPYDLVNFALQLNGGQLSTTSKVQLNADLDMSFFGSKFQPAGTAAWPFKGHFDGRGHTIRNLHVEGTRYVGLFGFLGDGAEVENLVLDSSCSFVGDTYVGAIAGRAQRGAVSFRACGNEASVLARTSMAGGILGAGYRAEVVMENCYNTGLVSSDSLAAAMMGWNTSGKATLSGCYNTASVAGATAGSEFAASSTLMLEGCFDLQYPQVTLFTATQLANGELCWMLNEPLSAPLWRQNLDNGKGRDSHPVLSIRHGRVYYADGRYTNENPNAHGHRYYKLDISAVASGNLIQFSEFDLLDGSMEEMENLRVYGATPSSIAAEDWPLVADNSTGTKYCSVFYGRAYFLFDAGEDVDAYGYRIYTANDTQSNSGRNPVSWTLSYSDVYTEDPDADVWEVLDEQVYSSVLKATNFMPYDFLLDRSIQSIAVQPSVCEMVVGGRTQLSVVATPATAALENLRWSSSDETVAVVDKGGVVTAVAEGEAIITVEVPEMQGIFSQCRVTVSAAPDGFQYYMLHIAAMQMGGTGMQLGEFELMDEAFQSYADLSIYYCTQEGYKTTESWDKLCDKDTHTKFCAAVPSMGVRCFFDAGSIIKPVGYCMYTANDTQKYPNRNPATWTLWGSNVKTQNEQDGSWVLLDSHTDDTTMGAVNYCLYPFFFEWPDAVGGVRRDVSSDGTAIFDLQGRKIQKNDVSHPSLQRGVYIVGDRKILVK